MRDTLRDIESGSHVIRVKVGPGLTEVIQNFVSDWISCGILGMTDFLIFTGARWRLAPEGSEPIQGVGRGRNERKVGAVFEQFGAQIEAIDLLWDRGVQWKYIYHLAYVGVVPSRAVGCPLSFRRHVFARVPIKPQLKTRWRRKSDRLVIKRRQHNLSITPRPSRRDSDPHYPLPTH